jgi:DNA polymerase-3 subunit delta'
MLSPADIVAVLEQHGIVDRARTESLARLAGGSVARALALNDEGFWRVREELIGGITSDRPNFGRLAETWQRFYEEAGKDTASQRFRVSLVISFLLETLTQALRLSLGAGTTAMSPADETRLRSFADRLGPDRLLELIDKCIEADSRVERRVQLILVIESFLEQLTKPDKARG